MRKEDAPTKAGLWEQVIKLTETSMLEVIRWLWDRQFELVEGEDDDI